MVFCSPGFGARTKFYNRPTFREQANPASITQASLLNDIRAAVSVSNAHFSVCIEHVEDICEDIDQALKG